MRLLTRLFPPKIPLEELSLFCGNLATCLAAGLDVPKSLRTCQRSASGSLLRPVVEDAAEQTAAGEGLSDTLEPWSQRFPAFFLPVLRCGEESGRIDDTLRYLERHCRLLVEPARVLRNTWLMPLCAMLAGSAVCMVGYAILAPLRATFAYLRETVMFYGLLAAGVWGARNVPSVKAIVDRLRLLIPVVGQAERELAINRFFHAMSLLYGTGGRRVEHMVRLAADSTGNEVFRAEFLQAAGVIESGGTIGEAFQIVSTLSLEYQSLVIAGDEAGKLEAAFDTVSARAGATAVHRLTLFQQLFVRVVVASVIGSMVMTLTSLAMLR